ncbi:MAG: adenylate/guanylate cyclase domain-containing protein [Bacteroidota bacterium]
MLAQVFAISDYAAGGGAVATPDGSAIEVDAGVRLFANLAVAFVGCLVGIVELLFLNRRLAARSLGTKLVAKTLFYVAFLTGVVVVTYPVAAALEMDTGLADPRVWDRLQTFAISKESLSTAVQLTTSLVVSLFYAEISEHIGPRVLTNFLVGRYHTPKEECRVFLFSDMKSSTSITEQLGHARYFTFLRAYYAALAEAIVDHGGEVYQYIGDEIVVSWPEEAGVHNGECIRCVLRMKRDLLRKAAWFEEHYGLAPDFRAGLQVGPVTTGEIGALKKEIVFTGDVLNQTARIQSLCKSHQADVLVGDELVARLGGGDWILQSVGMQDLRGKDRPVELFALQPSL